MWSRRAKSYLSIEHAKRYTALGMATDQGEASTRQRRRRARRSQRTRDRRRSGAIFRPPFTPVPMTGLAGYERARCSNPVRRLPLEARHRAHGAVFDDYGGWLARPFTARPTPRPKRSTREIRLARDAAAIFDGSPLGKIEVIGPDAAAFLDFNSYMTMSTLAAGPAPLRLAVAGERRRLRRRGDRPSGPGALRGLLLDFACGGRPRPLRRLAAGSVRPVARLRPQLHRALDDADRFRPAVAGRRSARLGVDLADAALPHMSLAEGRFAGDAARVARVSFTGDRSYEISVRATQAERCSTACSKPDAISAPAFRRRGADGSARREGLLRRRQGHRRDDDAARHGLRGPAREARRRLHRQALAVHRSRQRAGSAPMGRLRAEPRAEPLPCGAHVVDLAGSRPRSTGFVTSSYGSPTLGRPIALGLVERGAARIGEAITLQHLGRRFTARIAGSCEFDPKESGSMLDRGRFWTPRPPKGRRNSPRAASRSRSSPVFRRRC